MTAMWDRAFEAAEDARAPLHARRANGAASRAYYAMYCAARAAIRHLDPSLDRSKTHSGIIRTFSKEVIGRAGLDRDLGRMLSAMEGVRLKADYDDAGASLAEADDAVADMEVFLSAIATFIGKDYPPPHDP